MSTTTSPTGGDVPQDAREEAVEDAGQLAAVGSSERGRQMAKARWEKHRSDLARQQEMDRVAADAAGGALVTVPVDIGGILRELRRKASGGDVSASRELREWLRQYPPDDGAASVEQLDRPTRKALSSILTRALTALEEGEVPASGGFREGTIDGFDALPDGSASQPGATPAGDEPLRASGAGGGSQPLDTPQTPASAGLVEELLQERREEAARENEE